MYSENLPPSKRRRDYLCLQLEIRNTALQVNKIWRFNAYASRSFSNEPPFHEFPALFGVIRKTLNVFDDIQEFRCGNARAIESWFDKSKNLLSINHHSFSTKQNEPTTPNFKYPESVLWSDRSRSFSPNTSMESWIVDSSSNVNLVPRVSLC